jgi:hypothetical protein
LQQTKPFIRLKKWVGIGLLYLKEKKSYDGI